MRRGPLHLPDFIIGGAARSGTTWLCHLLARHPSVALARPLAPEPKFFLVDDLYRRGLGHYSETWFAGLGRPVLGEKSTNYLDDPACAERIAADLPQARMVFVLRDPVERAYSNYRWSSRNGHETEPFEVALALDPMGRTSDALRYARPFDYLARGRYWDRLAPFFARLGPRRIMLLSFERLALRPSGAAADLHRFLGVAERPWDANGLPPVNGAGGPAAMSDAARRFLEDHYAAPNAELRERTGFDVGAWGRPVAPPGRGAAA